MAKADGSIIIETDLDAKEAQEKLDRLKTKIENLNEKISDNKAAKMPLVEQAKELGAQLDAASAKLDALKNSGGNSEAIKQQAETVKVYQSEWNRVNAEIDRYDRAIKRDEITLDRSVNKAGELSAVLAQAGYNSEQMAGGTKKAEKSANAFASRLKSVVRSALVFTVITQALSKLRSWLGDVVKASPEASAAIAKLKGALLTMVQPLVNVVIPAFTTLVNVLTAVVSKIAQVFAMLTGSTLDSSKQAAKALNEETKALNGTGSAAKKAGKSLAGFDEINKLTSNASSGNASIVPDFRVDNKMSKFMERLSELLSSISIKAKDVFFDWDDLTWDDILDKIITDLFALSGGIIGEAFGGVPGAVIGATLGTALALAMLDLDDGTDEGDKAKLHKELLAILALALPTIFGALWGGPIGALVGLSIGTILSLFIQNLDPDEGFQFTDEDRVRNVLSVLLGIISGGILGGVKGALIGGVVGLALSMFIGELLESTDNPDLSTLFNSILESLLVANVFKLLGASKLLRFKAGIATLLIGLSIKFFLAGAEMRETVKEIGEGVGTGIMSGILTKILQENGYNKKVYYENGEYIAKGVEDGATSGASTAMKNFSEALKKSFTSNMEINSPSRVFWQYGIYLIDGILRGLKEKYPEVNLFFESFKTQSRAVFEEIWSNAYTTTSNYVDRMIFKINSLKDAMSSLGGNISTERYESIPWTVPHLAQGAVIPPNREFLAVLGDQKQGTNYEVPDAKLRQLLREELSAIGGGNEAVLMLDREVLGKVVYKLNKAESRRIGVNLAGV